MSDEPERKASASTHAERERFIHDLGLVLESEGLSPIAGRLFAQLVLAERAMSFAELAEALQISRASVSSNTRSLMATGMIEHVRLKGSNQSHYVLCERPLERIVQTQIDRNRRHMAPMVRAHARMSDLAPNVRERLAELALFYTEAEKMMLELLKLGAPHR